MDYTKIRRTFTEKQALEIIAIVEDHENRTKIRRNKEAGPYIDGSVLVLFPLILAAILGFVLVVSKTLSLVGDTLSIVFGG
jgi:hypothetical protein